MFTLAVVFRAICQVVSGGCRSALRVLYHTAVGRLLGRVVRARVCCVVCPRVLARCGGRVVGCCCRAVISVNAVVCVGCRFVRNCACVRACNRACVVGGCSACVLGGVLAAVLCCYRSCAAHVIGVNVRIRAALCHVIIIKWFIFLFHCFVQALNTDIVQRLEQLPTRRDILRALVYFAIIGINALAVSFKRVA